jgi:hypothetical protein
MDDLVTQYLRERNALLGYDDGEETLGQSASDIFSFNRTDTDKLDAEIYAHEYLSCSDCTQTDYLKKFRKTFQKLTDLRVKYELRQKLRNLNGDNGHTNHGAEPPKEAPAL